jgi:transposase
VDSLIPPARRGGNKRHVDVREVMNGIMYVLSTGCQWRAKKTTLNVWRVVLKGHRDDFWFDRDRIPKDREPHPKSASALVRRPTK